MKLKKSFRLNLYLLFTVSIIFPIFLIFGIFTWYYNQQTVLQDRRHVSNILTSMSKNIEISFNELEHISFTPYLYKDVLGCMTYMKNGYLENRPDFLEVNRLEEVYNLTFTKLMYSSSNHILGIGFYPMSKQDSFVYQLDHNTAGLQTLSQPGYFSDALFLSARKAGGNPLYTPFHTQQGKYNSKEYFSLVRMIKDFDSQKEIGVLRIDASTESLKNVIDQVDIPGKSRVLLVDDLEHLIYSSGDIDPAILPQLSNRDTVSANGDSYLVTREKIPRFGWSLIYLSSKKDILISNAQTYLLAFGLMIFAVLISFFIYCRGSSKMVSSVSNILQTIRKIQTGDLSAKSTVKETNTELALISDALNEMAQQLNDHIIREYKAVISQRNAEYIALQSQINPHFLYNTLNGFIALNRMGERDTLEKAILQLTHLFRYTCKNESISTVGQELDFVSRYLELQKLRFEDRLNFRINIQPEAEELEIPKLLIQPIVENCIVHGMEPQDDPIHIEISAETCTDALSGKCLRLVVEDDGLGFDPGSVKPASSRVGLENIRDRVELFNPHACFVLESAPGKGTQCVILFPIQK